MKYETQRQEAMKARSESKLLKLEQQVLRARGALKKAQGILTKHEMTLARKSEKGVEPGITQERYDNKREVAEKLEAKVAMLEALTQRIRYELERVIQFNPVQKSLDQLPPGFKKAKKREWRIVNSRFKTFQDVFTPPGARVLPDTRVKPTRKKYDTIPLDVCPVEPDFIPDWLIEEFDLGNLEGLSDFERLERKAELTPDVRELFSHLQPLQVGRNISYRTLTLEDYDEAHDGKVLVASYMSREEETKDRKSLQLYGDAYEAHRRMLHADSGYEREQEKIEGISRRLQGIIVESRGMKKSDPKRPKIVKRLISELEVLGHVVNFYKVEAADILSEVWELKDRLGRHNPSAVGARMLKAVDMLEKRLPQIFEKSQYVSQDKKMLSKTIHKGRGVLDQAKVASLDLCESLENLKGAGDLDQNLAAMPELDELRMRPFNQYADKIQDKMAAIKGAQAEGNKEALRDQAINAYVACKVFEVQHERERILRDIAGSPMETTISALLKRAQQLQEIVTSKETFPGVRTGENEPYREMAGKIGTLVRGLQVYSKRRLTESERLAMYERLKKYLEDIDFPEILEKL